jgi:hypothetical protein
MPGFFLSLLFTAFVHAGSAGVKNGTISGVVRDYKRQPIAGATAIAVRQTDPPLIRNAVTNENGIFTLNNMPVGAYTLGFDKYGYEPITTEEGDKEQQSAIGKQIRVYVESGSHVKAPAVTLKYIGVSGDAFVKVNLIDAITGEKIDAANVSVGSSTVNFGSAGTYYLAVPAGPQTNGGESGQPIKISAPGYQEIDDHIAAVPFQTTEKTIALTPKMATIQGQIDLSRYPVSDIAARTRISVDGIPDAALDAHIEDSGFFSIRVPASNANNKRFFNVGVFVAGFMPATVSQVYAPESGATTITAPVTMIAQTVPVGGKVLPSSGAQVSNSAVNQAFIKELGVSSSISSGSYRFDSIPSGIELEISVIIMGPEGIESGSRTFTAVDNGTGFFHLPTIITSPE